MKHNIYNSTNTDGEYVIIKLFSKYNIPSKYHKVAVACIYACEDNEAEAIKLFKSLNSENIEQRVDELVQAVLHSYKSWQGITLYECKDCIITGIYSSTKSIVEDEIKDVLLSAYR